MPRPKTHDDALRSRLFDAAGEILSTEGPNALSVRRLATEVGTSTTAVYSLFGGKPGLLRELFVEAFRRFGAHLDKVEMTDNPIEDIHRLGHAYRDSAHSDPHLYRVMFGNSIPGFDPEIEDLQEAEGTFLTLLDAVRRGVEAGMLRQVEPGVIAMSLWANLHGLVMLEMSDLVPPSGADPSEIFDQASRALLDGWRA